MLVYLLSSFYMHGRHCVHSFLYLELFIKHYILVKKGYHMVFQTS